MSKSTIASGHNRMSKWQYALLLLMLVTFSLYSLPTFFGERPALGIHHKGGWHAERQVLLTTLPLLPEQEISNQTQTLLVFSSLEAQQKARHLLE